MFVLEYLGISFWTPHSNLSTISVGQAVAFHLLMDPMSTILDSLNEVAAHDLPAALVPQSTTLLHLIILRWRPSAVIVGNHWTKWGVFSLGCLQKKTVVWDDVYISKNWWQLMKDDSTIHPSTVFPGGDKMLRWSVIATSQKTLATKSFDNVIQRLQLRRTICDTWEWNPSLD